MSDVPVCPQCNKVFTHRKNLYQHQRNIHKTEPDLFQYPKNFTCDICGITFSFSQNLYRHKKKVHNVVICLPGKHECTLCNDTFRTQHGYLRHLEMSHNEKSKTLIFNSKEEFEVWKGEEEEKSKSFFSTRSCYRVFNNARRTNFLCHRYGEFKSTNTGRRCLKMQGSTREGNHCTARMEVTEFEDGIVRVIYFPKHKLHQDSVDHVGKKDKGATMWLTMEEDNSLVVEKVTLNRKSRVRRSDIKDVHWMAESLDRGLILRGDESSGWLVRSEKDENKTYRVSPTGNPCYPGTPSRKCSLNCVDCGICIHNYKCSCDNWAAYGGLMCKHIHLVAMICKESSHYTSPNQRLKVVSIKLEQEAPEIDNSIFVEIELTGDEIAETPLEIPRLMSESPQVEVDFTTFEAIMNVGKNAAVSDLSPELIHKLNTSAHEYLFLLQSLLSNENPNII